MIASALLPGVTNVSRSDPTAKAIDKQFFRREMVTMDENEGMREESALVKKRE